MSKLRLIAVSGIIGVGKTTLARNLSKVLGAGLICEEYDRNPFLADAILAGPILPEPLLMERIFQKQDFHALVFSVFHWAWVSMTWETVSLWASMYAATSCADVHAVRPLLGS